MEKRRLLIVDDEDDVRLANKSALGKEWAITEADGFLSAKEKIEHQEHFDAYLIDIVMPLENKDMDPGLVEETGVRFIEWLLNKEPEAAIVLLTVRDNSMNSPEFMNRFSSKCKILPKFRTSAQKLRDTLNAVIEN